MASVDPETPQALNAELRELAALKPTLERRARVEALLAHKWEGVQTVASQVLATWGGPESVAALRAWLAELDGRRYSWAARGVAAKALASSVTAADLAWAVDLYFEQPTLARRFEIFPILRALPRAETIKRLKDEARHRDPERREAATRALTWISAN